MPTAPAMSDLPMDAESRPDTRTSENTMMAQRSAGASFSAMAASGIDRMMRLKAEMVSPKKEENSEHLRAFSPLPCRASGYPS